LVAAKINVFFAYWESAFGTSRPQIFIRRALRTNDKFVRPQMKEQMLSQLLFLAYLRE
jgi:hypothetical protein